MLCLELPAVRCARYVLVVDRSTAAQHMMCRHQQQGPRHSPHTHTGVQVLCVVDSLVLPPSSQHTHPQERACVLCVAGWLSLSPIVWWFDDVCGPEQWQQSQCCHLQPLPGGRLPAGQEHTNYKHAEWLTFVLARALQRLWYQIVVVPWILEGCVLLTMSCG